MRLKQSIDSLRGQRDLVIIDTPPDLGFLMTTALIASDWYIIPVFPSGYDLKGLETLWRTVEKVKERYNPKLQLLGVLIGNFDSRPKLDADIQRMLSQKFGGQVVFSTVINRSVKHREACIYGQTIFERAAGQQAAEQYLALAREVFGSAGKVASSRDDASRRIQGGDQWLARRSGGCLPGYDLNIPDQEGDKPVEIGDYLDEVDAATPRSPKPGTYQQRARARSSRCGLPPRRATTSPPLLPHRRRRKQAKRSPPAGNRSIGESTPGLPASRSMRLRKRSGWLMRSSTTCRPIAFRVMPRPPRSSMLWCSRLRSSRVDRPERSPCPRSLGHAYGQSLPDLAEERVPRSHCVSVQTEPPLTPTVDVGAISTIQDRCERREVYPHSEAAPCVPLQRYTLYVVVWSLEAHLSNYWMLSYFVRIFVCVAL